MRRLRGAVMSVPWQRRTSAGASPVRAGACWLGSEGNDYMVQTILVEASRQRDIEYPDANPQAVTCVKPGVAPSAPPSHPGEGIGNAEPLYEWRRLERSATGQETRVPDEGRSNGVYLRPEACASEAGRFPGVAGMACGEGVRREPWEAPGPSPFRGGNHAIRRGKRAWGIGVAHSSEEGG